MNKQLIQEAYKNYRDSTYDLTNAKTMILHFILANHICHRLESTDPNNYKLNISGHFMLKFSMKYNDDIVYHIDVKTAKLIS